MPEMNLTGFFYFFLKKKWEKWLENETLGIFYVIYNILKNDLMILLFRMEKDQTRSSFADFSPQSKRKSLNCAINKRLH